MPTQETATIQDAQRTRLAGKIRGIVQEISNARFPTDPLLPKHASLATSQASSAFKRHGQIITEALIIGANSLTKIQCSQARLAIPGKKTKLQADIIAYDPECHELVAYELKRGGGAQDSDAIKNIRSHLQMLEDALPVYAKSKKWEVSEFKAYVICYFGELGDLKSAKPLTKQDLVRRFGKDVIEFVEEANSYYRFCLLRKLQGVYAAAIEEIENSALKGSATLDEFRKAARSRRHPWDELQDG